MSELNKQSFEEIAESYHVTLDDNRRDESIKLAAEKYAAQFQQPISLEAISAMAEKENGTEFYIASQTKHAAKWIELRSKGYNIISTWIDKAGVGESASLEDLIDRCIKESMQADVMILYCEPNDFLKCALVEVGAALSANRKVIIVGSCPSISPTLLAHKNVTQFPDVEDAIIHFKGFTSALGYSAGDNWIWTDELVLEFAVRSHLPKREITIDEFKQMKNEKSI